MEAHVSGVGSQWVNIGTRQVHYIEAGSGQPLFFIHGVGSNCHAFVGQMELFREWFHCISVDIPGHNASKTRPRNYSVQNLARIMWELMDSIDITSSHPILMGHSYGGAVVQELLHEHPGIFEAAILSHTTANIRRGAISGLASALAPLGYPFAWNLWVRGAFGALTNVHPHAPYSRRRTITRDAINTSMVPILEMTRSMYHFNSEGWLNDLDLPVLVLTGTMDHVIPYKHSAYLRKNIPGSVLKIVRRSGHQSHIENPEMVNRYMDRFLYIYR